MFSDFQGTKYELSKEEVKFKSLLDSMRAKLFEGKEPFLIHLLRKELGKQLRKDLRQNIKADDVIIYSDFSKGFNSNCYFVDIKRIFSLRVRVVKS